MATLTAAQMAALKLLEERAQAQPEGPDGHLATVRNGPKWVGYQTAKALERMSLAVVSPAGDGYWVTITDEGRRLLAGVSELHSSTNAQEA